jgi:arginase
MIKRLPKIGLVNYFSGAGQRKSGVSATPGIVSSFIKKSYKKSLDIERYNTFNLQNDKIFNYCKHSTLSFDNFHLANNVLLSLNENQKTIVIGGDHSLGIGSLAGSLHHNPDTHVIWIDAHADINTPEASESQNYHGMPLSFICNLTDMKMKWIKNYLDPSKLIYLGLRDVDDFEKDILKQYNITNYSASETIANLPDIMKEVSLKIKDKPVHLSVDVDAFDPSLIYSTGTPVDGGLELEHFAYIVKQINEATSRNKIMDLAELNLKIGNKKQQDDSLRNSLELINMWLFS